MSQKDSIVFLSAKRTPFGAFGGSLKALSATDLGVIAAKAAVAEAGADVDDYDHVAFGNVCKPALMLYLARHVGLHAGLPERTPAITLNRLCGSGFQGVVTGVTDFDGSGSVGSDWWFGEYESGTAAQRGTRWGHRWVGPKWKTCSGRVSLTRIATRPRR